MGRAGEAGSRKARSRAAPSTPLEQAIEGLYTTFAGYPLAGIAACACCVSPEEEARLTSKRLRELDGDDLASFAFCALNTWGSLRGFKHFLPRILELKAQGTLWVDLQILYGKLVQEGPWPEGERAAVEQFTVALASEAMLNRGPERLRDVIESAGIAGMDVAGLLSRAIDGFAPTLTASALAHFVIDQATELATGRVGWIFWKDGERRGDAHRWLASGVVRSRLVAAFEADPEHADAGDWAMASDILESLGG